MQISSKYWESSVTVLLRITGTAHPMVILTNARITTCRHTRNHMSFNSSLYVGISIRLLQQRSVREDSRIQRTPKSVGIWFKWVVSKKDFLLQSLRFAIVFSEALQDMDRVTHRVLYESVDYRWLLFDPLKCQRWPSALRFLEESILEGELGHQSPEWLMDKWA